MNETEVGGAAGKGGSKNEKPRAFGESFTGIAAKISIVRIKKKFFTALTAENCCPFVKVFSKVACCLHNSVLSLRVTQELLQRSGLATKRERKKERC